MCVCVCVCVSVCMLVYMCVPMSTSVIYIYIYIPPPLNGLAFWVLTAYMYEVIVITIPLSEKMFGIFH